MGLVREIEPRLRDLMLDKLKNVAAAQAAIKAKDFRQVMVFGVDTLVGAREKTGHNDGEIIELIQETVGNAVREPYCIGGVMTGIAFAEVICERRSPLIATELATELWNRTPAAMRVAKVPAPGAVALWQDIRNGQPLYTGHGEIVRAASTTQFYCIGFNTSGSTYPGGPVVREGNGVYYTTRSYESTSKRRLLGFLKPI